MAIPTTASTCGGHTSFDAWLIEFEVFSRATAYRAMRIAEEFSSAMFERFGKEKLTAAIEYLGATKQTELAGDILSLQVRIRGEDGQWTTVPFVDARPAQIREAIRHLNEGRNRGALTSDLRRKVDGPTGPSGGSGCLQPPNPA